jgi:hypothetical protein
MVCFILGDGSLQNEEHARLYKDQVDVTNTHFLVVVPKKTKKTKTEKERLRVRHTFIKGNYDSLLAPTCSV